MNSDRNNNVDTLVYSSIYTPIINNFNGNWFNTYIYCPQSSSFENTIYAKNGFDDVFYEFFNLVWSDNGGSSTMYCGNNYQYSCTQWIATFSDPIWNCPDLTNPCANTKYSISSDLHQNAVLPVPTT